MSVVPGRCRQSRGHSLKSHVNVGYWADGDELPVSNFFRFAGLAKTKKARPVLKIEENPTPGTWFYLNGGKKAVILSEDEAKTIEFSASARAALLKSGNTTCQFNKHTTVPMHPEVFEQVQQSEGNKKQKKKRPVEKEPEEEEEQPPPKKKKKPNATRRTEPMIPMVVALPDSAPLPPTGLTPLNPLPIAKEKIFPHDGDYLESVIPETWTGYDGFVSISASMESDTMIDDLHAILTSENSWKSPELLGSFYSNLWHPTLAKLAKIDTGEIPGVIEPEHRRVALDCLKVGFLTMMRIYERMVPPAEILDFVKDAMSNWALPQDSPFVEFVLTGPGIKDATTGEYALKQAQFAAGRDMARPEYGSATFLGMWIAFVFYVTW
jgi:hypothetical protein